MLLMSSLLCNLVLVAIIADDLASQVYDVGNVNMLFNEFMAISEQTALTLNQDA